MNPQLGLLVRIGNPPVEDGIAHALKSGGVPGHDDIVRGCWSQQRQGYRNRSKLHASPLTAVCNAVRYRLRLKMSQC